MPQIQKVSGLKNIYKVDSFDSDMDALFKNNKGDRKRFEVWLYTKLAILDSMGRDAILLEQFEDLVGTQPKLYAIRHPHSILNERYVYVYVDGEDVLLLTAFKEKSKRDYDPAIQRAYNILNNLKE